MDDWHGGAPWAAASLDKYPLSQTVAPYVLYLPRGEDGTKRIWHRWASMQQPCASPKLKCSNVQLSVLALHQAQSMRWSGKGYIGSRKGVAPHPSLHTCQQASMVTTPMQTCGTRYPIITGGQSAASIAFNITGGPLVASFCQLCYSKGTVTYVTYVTSN